MIETAVCLPSWACQWPMPAFLVILPKRHENWAGTGRAVDLGEAAAQAAVRETLEESGIECEVTGIVGIYSDPRHVILYTSNGEVRREFSMVRRYVP